MELIDYLNNINFFQRASKCFSTNTFFFCSILLCKEKLFFIAEKSVFHNLRNA